jgi:RHS repeat-associated protein
MNKNSPDPPTKKAAADNNRVAAPSISVPKGGGALKGISEKFATNPVTGTASLKIPIPTSTTRSSFAPQVTLSYDSGSGNSPFGLGWAVAVPAITRKSDKGLPRYQDAADSDTFMLLDSEDLVPSMKKNLGGGWDSDAFDTSIAGITYNVQRYRPRVEGAFARIEKIVVQGEPGSYWKVTTKDNVTTVFGRTAAARIADPDDDNRVYKWLAEWSWDDKGNCLNYTYKPEDLINVPLAINERNRLSGLAPFSNQYLKQINYGNKNPYYADPANPYKIDPPTNPQWFFATVFDYGEHNDLVPTPVGAGQWQCRFDSFSDYRAGFEIRTNRLCRRILSFHFFSELNLAPGPVPEPYLVSSLDLSYQHFKFDNSPFKNEEADFITAVTQVSYKKTAAGAYQRKSLPAFEISYHELDWNKEVKTISPADLMNAPVGIGENYQWVDLLNEGVSGIFSEQANGWYYKSNLGEGRFNTAVQIGTKPSFIGVANGGLQFQDLDANGTKQLVTNQSGLKGYFELTDFEGWSEFRQFRTVPDVAFNDPNTKFIDLNNDGRPELVISEENVFAWFPSQGTKGFDTPELTPKPFDEEKGPAIVFADETQSIYVADMSGDGLPDIVRIRNGEICYWPNLGYGKFGAKVSTRNAPQFDRPEQFNPSYLHLADISGTGATDILYLGQNKFKAWLNLSGNAWSETQEIDPFPTTELPNRVSVIDLLGNGTACIVWSSSLQKYATSPMQYIDLMGGKKPFIVSGYKNNLGLEVSLKYRSSASYYLQDKKEGHAWATKLPFPVQCVSKVESRDTVSDLFFVQEYRYRHGYYDHAEREFRGFGMVEQLDTQTFAQFRKSGAANIVSEPLHQPPMLTRTWFHTGAFISKDRILRQFEGEYYRNPVFAEHHLPDAVIKDADLLPATLTPEELQQAYRACKGMTLRQEVYALDGSTDEEKPYSAAEHNCDIRVLQPMLNSRYAVFLVHESEAITYHYERAPEDPRITHTLNIRLDEIGNVIESASVVYGRVGPDLSLPGAIQDEQARLHVTYTKNSFTNDIVISAAYHLRLLYDAQTFELTGVQPGATYFTPEEIRIGFLGAIPISYETNPTSGINQSRLIEHTRTLFARDSNVNLPLALGTLESLGLQYESYQLAFTPSLLSVLYGAKVITPMLVEGRYINSDDYKTNGRFPASDPSGNLWIPSGIVQYPPNPAQRFFLPDRYIDPFGTTTTVKFYSDYFLLIEETTDALGNKTTVESFDFRLLRPQSVKDINDNITEISSDILGLVVGTALKGKGSEADDLIGFNPDLTQAEINAYFADPATQGAALLQNASSRFVYDLTAIPVYAGSITRETHQRDAVASGVPSKLQFAFEYSDGSGHVVMKKIQAEPGKAKQGVPGVGGAYVITEIDTTPNRRWVGSGRTILNNKGKAVMQYEPYFSVTHRYESAPELVEIGVTPVMYYDPVGRLIKTDFPNSTFSSVSFNSWKQSTSDQNDNVVASAWYAARIGGALGADEQDAAQKAFRHDQTPSVAHLDSLGRTVLTVAHNKFTDRVTSLIREEFYNTRVDFDIEGNQRKVTDARGNVVMLYAYDMLGHQVFQTSMDAGERWILNDAMGKALYGWDTKGNRFHTIYDVLHRPTELELLNPAAVTIVYDKSQYGTNKATNQNGKLVKHFDGSGITSHTVYDFKGNILTTTREFTVAYDSTPDWTNVAGVPLQAPFTTITEFDALSRATEITTPDSSRTVPSYDESNLLEQMKVSIRGAALETVFVESINHDAKGQRLTIDYGNNTITSYDYDPLTFRLVRLQTIRTGDNAQLQDLNFTYDPVGNITRIKDLAQQTVYFSNAVVLGQNNFTYDAVYRLQNATGREQAAGDAPVSEFDELRLKLPHPNDAVAMRNYLQQYEYDGVGNMLRMVHGAGTGAFTNRWTREFGYLANNNRLASSTVGPTTINYTYDVHGNVDQMPHLPDISWDFDNRLRSVDLRGGGTAYYTYDADGNRVRKVIERLGGIVEERLYVGKLEVFTRTQPGVAQLRRETLHVMDDTRRIAMIDSRTAGMDTSLAELIRYQFSNHLGTASLELDDNAAIISYEEYYPFGSTSYQAVDSSREVPTKRYRYTGKERDEETGFYYHGARYYAPWLARWTAPDPMGIKDGINRYVYSGNRPIASSDPTGMWEMPSWRTVAVIAAVVVVGTVVAVATAGAAAPLVAAAVASIGLSGTAGAVATGVVVGAVAGGVGGGLGSAAGEATRQTVNSRALGLGREEFSGGRILSEAGRGARQGAIIGAAVGGVAALATTTAGVAAIGAAGRVIQRAAPTLSRLAGSAGRGIATGARAVANAPGIRQVGLVVRQGLNATERAAENLGIRAAQSLVTPGSNAAQAVTRFAQTRSIAGAFNAAPTRIFRVQGGVMPRASHERIVIGGAGQLVIRGRGMLHATLEDAGHVRTFLLQNRRGVGAITSFEVDASFANQVRGQAVRQAQARLNPGAPQIDDPTRSSSAFGLPAPWQSQLSTAAVPGSGRVGGVGLVNNPAALAAPVDQARRVH